VKNCSQNCLQTFKSLFFSSVETTITASASEAVVAEGIRRGDNKKKLSVKYKCAGQLSNMSSPDKCGEKSEQKRKFILFISISVAPSFDIVCLGKLAHKTVLWIK
jgi:hypothetical protein